MSTTLKRWGGAVIAVLALIAGLQFAQAAPNNTETAYRYFVSRGLSPAQSAGLVGNFIVESGRDPINPDAKQFGGGPGRGIAQWEGSRRTDLYNYANRRQMPWNSLQLQLDFVWHEFSTTERYAFNQLKGATTPEDAAYRVRKFYERPSAHADQARKNAARSVYNRYAGTNPRPGNPAPNPPGNRPSVVGGPVNLRTDTNLNAQILLTIPEGAVLNIQCQAQGQTVSGTYTTNWWARVTYGGKTGWASRSYVYVPRGMNVPTCGSSAPAPAPAPPPAVTNGEVVGGPVTLRSGTNTGTAALLSIPQGTRLNVQCQARGQAINGYYNSDWWAKVTYNGRTGYASRAYIKVTGSLPVC